eukprot:6214347-Pleurochrysis_carterae.AAC.2
MHGSARKSARVNTCTDTQVSACTSTRREKECMGRRTHPKKRASERSENIHVSSQHIDVQRYTTPTKYATSHHWPRSKGDCMGERRAGCFYAPILHGPALDCPSTREHLPELVGCYTGARQGLRLFRDLPPRFRHQHAPSR